MATKNPKSGDAKSDEPQGPPRFEDGLDELEGLVQRLEQGELPLEDSLAAFERGMVLVTQLSKRLEDIEQRVEVLLRADDGSLRRGTFDEGD